MTTDNTSGVPPLVDAAAQAFDRAHESITARTTAARDASLTGWFEAFEAEHAGVIANALRHALDHDDVPPKVREALGPLIAPEHQTQVILGLFAVSQIVSQFVGAVLAPYVRDAESFAWSHDQTQPLSPADAAVAELKGVWDEATAMREAAYNGIAPDRYTTLRLIAGEPLALQELLLLYRRGQITDTELEHGIRQSRVRDEWIPFAKELRYAPVGAGEVLAGAVQGHLSPDDATRRISDAGVDPTNFDWLYATHGRPPGPMELLHLLNRGEITEADVAQAIRESDIKNKYIPAVIKLRRYLPPPRSVTAMLHHGALTDAEALALFLQNGLTPEDAAIYVKEAHALRTQTNRELAETQVVALYEGRFIDHAKASAMLASLGYAAESIDFLLALADHARHVRFQSAAVTRVHAQYVAHKIDHAKASTLLDRIEIPAEARDDLLALWGYELAANVPHFNLSELQGLFRRGKITYEEFGDAIVALGWERKDARKLAALAFPPNAYNGPTPP